MVVFLLTIMVSIAVFFMGIGQRHETPSLAGKSVRLRFLPLRARNDELAAGLARPFDIQIRGEHSVNTELKAGIYRHYKGKDYQVFQVARHSETEEYLVMYRCLYGDYSWWVRPLAMFLESVEVDGEPLERFAYVGPADASQINDVTALAAAQ